MKLRHQLSAAEVEALWSSLERRLDGSSVTSQPEVAAHILDLLSDPKAGLRDFAGAIRADAALSGRLLKLANSAYFAQRSPVTNLDRACVLLGLERLKGVALGFYLSKAAVVDAKADLSRQTWGQGVYRACLAAEIARAICPMYAPEAFVTGLMLDAGIPLVADWLGTEAREIYDLGVLPADIFALESAKLPFTHVDAMAALARGWKLPALLAKPLERHHMTPADVANLNLGDAIGCVQRIAYLAGSVRLVPNALEVTDPLDNLTSSRPGLLGLSPAALGEITRKAAGEFGAMRDLFGDVAGHVGDPVDLSVAAHQQLVVFTDTTLEREIRSESRVGGEFFTIGSHRVEIEALGGETCTAYLMDSSGVRFVSHVFRPKLETVEDILLALGLDPIGHNGERDELGRYLRSLAA